MHNKVTKKTLHVLGLIYIVIIGLINYCGFLMVTTQNMPVLRNEAYDYWLEYLNKNAGLINILSAMSFVLPTLFCVMYVFLCREEKLEGRIINLPVSFSIIGSLGWVFSLLTELVFLVRINKITGISMHVVGISSFLNIMQCCILISTLAFMSLYAIHCYFVLPKLFPEGSLGQYKGTRKVSSLAVISIFYASVSIFPIFYVVSTLRNYSMLHLFPIDKSFFVMLGLIVGVDIILLIAIAAYFGKPLKKMSKATEDVREEKFDQKIELVRNDDFGNLADSFNEMSHSIAMKNKRIVSIQDSIIRGMAVMVENRDNSTGGHIYRTSECVRVFVEKLKDNPKFEITDSFAKNIIKAAPMHDLGKIAVDDAVLRKPGKFTPEEFEIMKKHAEAGAGIVREVLKESDDEEFKQIAENVAHYHHEKWNGAGYPNGLKENDIPFEARIMALADVFDALVSKRCYKESMDYDKAFSIIEESLGTHFDPDLGAFFLSCREDLEIMYNGLPE